MKKRSSRGNTSSKKKRMASLTTEQKETAEKLGCLNQNDDEDNNSENNLGYFPLRLSFLSFTPGGVLISWENENQLGQKQLASIHFMLSNDVIITVKRAPSIDFFDRWIICLLWKLKVEFLHLRNIFLVIFYLDGKSYKIVASSTSVFAFFTQKDALKSQDTKFT